MGRDHCEPTVIHVTEFRSTRPHGARRCIASHLTSAMMCFNPRARMGRDDASSMMINALAVSIHAPAWGATTGSRGNQPSARFNPRARMGRDLDNQLRVALGCFDPRARMGRDVIRRSMTLAAYWRFDPRARMGRDYRIACRRDFNGFRSTRPHGARLDDDAPDTDRSCFDPRARMGRDQRDPAVNADLTMFRSTRPHGARPTASTVRDVHRSFNPRARMGRDSTELFGTYYYTVSIHAPAWGAT